MSYKNTLLVILFTLCACTTTTKKPPMNAPSDDASIKLAEAANSVSHSLLELARIQKVATPAAKGKKLPDPRTFNMQTRASVDWSGPIESLVKRVASANHYRVRILGQAPTIPVLVSVQANNQTLATILRNIDFQAGKKADIKVYPFSKIVELRYAKA